jgi:hypothetical protein
VKDPSEEVVTAFLQEFGPRLVELGSPIWEMQANALKRASYVQQSDQCRSSDEYHGGQLLHSVVAHAALHGLVQKICRKKVHLLSSSHSSQ